MNNNDIPYHLRTNKVVDRELFVSFLQRSDLLLNLTDYQYISLGGPFLEDFRLIHSRLGIKDMICVESDEKVYERQQFNKPISCIKCINNDLDDFLSSSDFEKPVIIWCDFMDPKQMRRDIDTFCSLLNEVPSNSILRITLNASPGSLGQPDIDRNSRPGRENSLQEYRLQKFRNRLTDYVPTSIESNDMIGKEFGKTVLKTLKLAVDRKKARLDYSSRDIHWIFSSEYKDGQRMVTATLILLDNEEPKILELIRDWEYSTPVDQPLFLNLPNLSAFERLVLESSIDKDLDSKNFPFKEISMDKIDNFRKFYRFYPQFSKVLF